MSSKGGRVKIVDGVEERDKCRVLLLGEEGVGQVAAQSDMEMMEKGGKYLGRLVRVCLRAHQVSVGADRPVRVCLRAHQVSVGADSNCGSPVLWAHHRLQRERNEYSLARLAFGFFLALLTWPCLRMWAKQ
jgi:hypothetical protein